MEELVPYKRISIAISSDNDAYFKPTNFDRYYTAGTSFNISFRESLDSKMKYIGLLSPFLQTSISRFSLGITQEIYTPDDKFSLIPSKMDMPYAGYLYTNFMVQNRTKHILEQVLLSLGVVGDMTMGKQAQDIIHKLTNNASFRGWDYQLKNEFIFNLSYKLLYKLSVIDNVFDILPYGVLSLGNAHTHLEVGTQVRLGYGLNGDFGIQKANNNTISSMSINDNFRLYLLASISETIVGRNMFVEGNIMEKPLLISIVLFMNGGGHALRI